MRDNEAYIALGHEYAVTTGARPGTIRRPGATPGDFSTSLGVVMRSLITNPEPPTLGGPMTGTAATATQSPKRGFFASLMWWKQSETEIENQTNQYATLSIWKSARGVSLLCCCLTAILTMLLGKLIGVTGQVAMIDAGIWLALGFLMYGGQRWAFVIAMIFWTLEKLGAVFTTGSPGTPIAQIIWWAAYMNAFYLGFKVEGRRRATVPPASARV